MSKTLLDSVNCSKRVECRTLIKALFGRSNNQNIVSIQYVQVIYAIKV